MPDLKNLSLVVSQAQGSVSLANTPNPKNLNLAVNQAHVGLSNISNPKNSGLEVS